jgi:AcrR family transcriptional regulator
VILNSKIKEIHMVLATETREFSVRRRAPEEKRARLREAAKRLFVEKGYDGCPTSEIAKAAGVSEGILFHQFGTKRDLFLSLAEEYGRECAHATMPSDAQDVTNDYVVRAAFDFGERDRDLYRLFATAGPKLGAFDTTPMSDAIVSVIQGNLEQDIQRGEVRSGDPRIMAELQFAVVDRAYSAWCRAETDASKEDYIAEAVRCMNAMLAP